MDASQEDLLNGKTPVSFLQELCTRYGMEPVYKLESQGPVTDPNFVYSVTAGDKSTSGSGTNKKKAKHNAALSLLHIMLPGQIPSQENQSNNNSRENLSKPENEVGGSNRGNSVGQLQELAQKQMLGMPVYEYSGGQGPSHAPNFICSVELRNVSITGRGMSKKLAKQKAADEMLKKLRDGSDLSFTSSSSDTNSFNDCNQADVNPSNNDNQSSAMARGAAPSSFMSVDALNEIVNSLKLEQNGSQPNGRSPIIGTLDPQTSLKISAFYKDLRSRKLPEGGTIARLQTEALNAPRVDYERLLGGIAEEHRFEATYVDLNELSAAGLNQCMLQLSSLPVAVVYGTGPSRESARALAAHNALQYLKIMTGKKKS